MLTMLTGEPQLVQTCLQNSQLMDKAAESSIIHTTPKINMDSNTLLTTADPSALTRASGSPPRRLRPPCRPPQAPRLVYSPEFVISVHASFPFICCRALASFRSVLGERERGGGAIT